MPQWTADIDINARLAAELVASQFPDLSNAAIEPFGSGWDNAAFLVDGRIVFRFPRRRAAAGLIEREVAILPNIAPQLPLSISAPQFIGVSTPKHPWMFAGYESIDGSTACSVNLSDGSRSLLAEPLAGFLRALHDIEPTQLIAKGLPPDELGRLNHEKRSKMTYERLPLIISSGHLDTDDVLTTWLEKHPPSPPEHGSRRLVHGDLYARHILLNTFGRPTGVIDWGDVHFGDPAIDIAIAHLILPPTAHGALRHSYGAIDDRTWNAARYRALYHAILELDYGIREDDAGMRQSGAAALRFIRTALEADVS